MVSDITLSRGMPQEDMNRLLSSLGAGSAGRHVAPPDGSVSATKSAAASTIVRDGRCGHYHHHC